MLQGKIKIISAPLLELKENLLWLQRQCTKTRRKPTKECGPNWSRDTEPGKPSWLLAWKEACLIYLAPQVGWEMCFAITPPWGWCEKGGFPHPMQNAERTTGLPFTDVCRAIYLFSVNLMDWRSLVNAVLASIRSTAYWLQFLFFQKSQTSKIKTVFPL